MTIWYIYFHEKWILKLADDKRKLRADSAEIETKYGTSSKLCF